jgi:FkbM family methyltransferase
MTKFHNVLTQTDYGPMIINIKDDTIGMCISEYGYWGIADIHLIRDLLTALFPNAERMCLLDVGTNIGTHTLAFAKFPFPNIEVHGFEAQREIFYMLAGTIALNNLSNVHCHHRAVSNQSGVEIRIPKVDYSAKANFGSYELEKAHNSWTSENMYIEGTSETVSTICIDDLGLTDVKLIKIDVEGMEDKVIEGASATINANRPLVFFEAHKTNLEPVRVSLASRGYAIFLTTGQDAVCIPLEHGIGVNGATRIA